MVVLSIPDLRQYLARKGWLTHPTEAEIRPLTGGVSSEILLVHDGARKFVVKQALPQLRVRDEWRCDPVRNLYEQDFMEKAGRIIPGAVPRLLHGDREQGLFLMEYLDGRWVCWKGQLMAGELSETVAARAGQLLGQLHAATWRDPEVAKAFDNTPLFCDLRVDPYLRTTGQRHPALQVLFEAESARLEGTQLALVHGDYSPKNLMTDGRDLKILDAEVAWFGDPAFDIAFLLNHLVLKAIRFPERTASFARLRLRFRECYIAALGPHWDPDLEARSVRLLLMLMLARISGKSPVEYFTPQDSGAQWIVGFVTTHLTASDLTTFEAFETALLSDS